MNITQKNVSILPNVKFAEIFPYMERAKVTLNVMPWFKDGTHDRIFNSLLHNSCPITDTSKWLLENLEPDKECANYSLERLDSLPEKLYEMLMYSDRHEQIVLNGQRKVK